MMGLFASLLRWLRKPPPALSAKPPSGPAPRGPSAYRRAAMVSAAAVLGCAHPATPVVAEPAVAAPVAAPVAASAMPPPVAPPRPTRRGECPLEKALDDFVMGQETTRCGELGKRMQGPAYEEARACVVTALRAQKALVVSWGGVDIDSLQRWAVAGRDGGDRYEVRWFWYDSCPSGCGFDDPGWSSVRCDPLVDLRAACALPARVLARADEEVRAYCAGDDHGPARRSMELVCVHRTDERHCGWEAIHGSEP